VTRAGLDNQSEGGLGEPTPGSAEDHPPPAPDEVERRSSRPAYVKVVTTVGVLLLVVSSSAMAVLYGLSNRYESQVTHENILEGVPEGERDVEDGPLNFLVLGTDSRADEQTEQFNSTGSNSDTIILVHIAKGLDRAFLVSIPRDSYVNIPPGGAWPGGKNKINAAFAFGGANLAARAVYDLTQIPLDGAMIVNFAGVRNMVDAVGGVHVCVPYDVPNYFTDYPQYKDGWDAGCHDMAGEETEIFIRQRHNVPGGDFGRMRSQQLVMKALADKATSKGMLANPAGLDALLLAAARSLTLDERMDMRSLAFALKGIRPDDLNFATAPHTATGETAAGSSVFLDEAGCQELFRALREDRAEEWLAAHPQDEVPTY
jgi:LCP family protein required for cell wall assembly